MKKILYLFCALTLALSSCSSDDASSSVLIKKIIEKDIDGDDYTVNYTYDQGNKISEETVQDGASTYKIMYSYDGNLINSITQVSGGHVDILTTLTYNATNLLAVLVDETDGKNHYLTKTYYKDNFDGSISFRKVHIDEVTRAETALSTGKLSYTDGNLVKEETTNTSETSTIVYEYDTKNNPFKNVLGIEFLLDNAELGYSKHNKTKETTTSSPGSNLIYSSAFTYDGNDFPMEAKHFDKDGKTEGTTQYFY
ncbi:hypothetical protein IR010_17715 [Flavobacterium sp. MR2016-29]|uniref:hypothetical protein n=1 Tax=Flavobacterium sp. MR2016-29 TaxID=2783795 RepID=UPI00188D2D81|nr:hypothetical protein [Flavobacterium sp. MR2016-29]MBF4494388.1 hypothetical protein [Flavobacterium sp. MR2016-29]